MRDFFRWSENPTDAEIVGVVRAYISYQARAEGVEADEDDPEWWAAEAFMFADTRGREELAWRLIVTACELATPEEDERTLGMVGVGSLENYINKGGEEALERVEAAAAVNPSMLFALACVWNKPFRDRIDRFLAAHGQDRR